MQDSEQTTSGESRNREQLKSRWLLGIAIAACLVLVTGLIPSPYIIERPGPTVDVFEEISLDGEDARPVIEIEDLETYPADGSLRLLTVTISGSPERPKSWLSLLPGVLDRAQSIRPVEEFFPEGLGEKERTEQNVVLMENSQEQAAAAAFTHLGIEVPVTLTVAGISDAGPAEGALEEGDVIVEAHGKPVQDFPQLRKLIVENGGEQPLLLNVERGGKLQEVAITPAVPQGSEEPMIGAVIQSEYELPHNIDILLSDIGGPSAGLVFALGVVEQLTPGSLLDGLNVAGTGTITSSGEVGMIGGLEQKMWAASRAGSELLLLPVGNCADLPEEIPDGLQIAPVATLDEAVEAISAVRDGGVPAGMEACLSR